MIHLEGNSVQHIPRVLKVLWQQIYL